MGVEPTSEGSTPTHTVLKFDFDRPLLSIVVQIPHHFGSFSMFVQCHPALSMG
jgi:hypothetical protein